MKDLEYDEFEVVLERAGDGYSARVVESPTGLAPAMPFRPPVATAELPALRLTMRGAGEGPPAEEHGAADTAPVDPKAFGTALFRALFNEKAIGILRTSQYVSAKSGHGLRLRIRFTDVAELANLPWELLYDPDKHRYLCQYRAFPTVRLLDLPEPVPPLKVTGPLRMLVVISSPKDLPELDVEKEWMLLHEELEPLVRAGRIELVRLAVPTLEALHQKVLAEDFHVFHFIGHGDIDANGEGYLVFVRPTGTQHKVPGSHLGVILTDSPIRLAVLNSCHGGAVLAEDPYGSSAIALVEQGIPAVIAMQFEISDVAARTFSRTLYDSVAAGRPVDVGVTLGRQALLATSDAEWATPVLYLRGREGVLFELEDGPVDTILEDPEDVVEVGVAGPPTPPELPGRHVPEPPGESAPEEVAQLVAVGSVAPTDLVGSTEGTAVPAPAAGQRAGVAAPTSGQRAGVAAPTSSPTATPTTRPILTPTPPEPSDGPIEVRVRRVRRTPLVLLLVLVLALAGWYLIGGRGQALAAPANITTSIEAGLVSMSWDPPPADGPVLDRWEVYLGDQLVIAVPAKDGPRVSFAAQGSGELKYRVIAVGADGQKSEPGEAPPITVPPTTSSSSGSTSSSPTTQPSTTTQPSPPTEADVRIYLVGAQQVTRDSETVTFKTDNFGPAKVTQEQVVVEALGGGQLSAASFRMNSDGDRQPCALAASQASCDVGSHATKGQVVFVEVTVEWAPTSTGLSATVTDTGGTTDQDRTNNEVLYKHEPVPTGSLTFRLPSLTAKIPSG